MVNTDIIIDYLKEQVENKHPMGPDVWVDAAQKLNVLLSDEHDKLFNLQQQVAKKKLELLKDSKSVAEARIKTEASEEYREYQLQKAKVDRINEFIRIAKIQARLKSDEMRGYN
jgi:hypothetical protein